MINRNISAGKRIKAQASDGNYGNTIVRKLKKDVKAKRKADRAISKMEKNWLAPHTPDLLKKVLARAGIRLI